MIEAPFGTATMTLARGTHRGVAGRRATDRRAVRVAAITRRADREEAIAAATDLLAERRIHDVEAAARFDWTRLANRGTRERTGSVRRSIEAVTEGLEISPPGPHLDPPQGPQTISSYPVISRGRSAAAAPRHWCDRDRRRAPAGLFDDRCRQRLKFRKASTRVQIYAVSGER
jgi:hypothetical protein